MPGSVRALGDTERPPDSSPAALTRATAGDLADALVCWEPPQGEKARADDPPDWTWLRGIRRRDAGLSLARADADALAERVRTW